MTVAAALLDAIRSESLGPGDRLPPHREMAEKLGVSRPTVREALLALELAGFVECRADGAIVSTPPLKSWPPGHPVANDYLLQPELVIEARIAVEPAIARLCALRADGDSIRRLQLAIDQTEDLASDAKKLDDFVRLALDFHRDLAAACENQFLVDFCGALVDVNQQPLWVLVNRQAMQSRTARLTQVRDHRSIVEAIIERDAEAAERTARNHLEGLKQMIFDRTVED